MMKNPRMRHGALMIAAALLVLGAATAMASPIGDSYTVAGMNFPNTYPASAVTFDGVPDLVGGPSPEGLLVNESDTAFAGIPGGLATNMGAITEYANSGDLLEWNFRSNDNGPYNNAPGPWAWQISGLNFSPYPTKQFALTPYVYFIGPSGPVTLAASLVSGFGLRVGPHPTNPAITQVVYIDSDETLYPDGVIDIAFADDSSIGELNANTIAILTGQPVIRGFVLGGLYVAEPPPPPMLVGDANGDCEVGAADYAIWAAQFGQTAPGLSSDFDGNGSVGAGDYALWAANFGKTCPPAGASVPEPSSLVLLVVGLAAVWVKRSRR